MSRLSDTVNAHTRLFVEVQNDIKDIKNLLQESMGVSSERMRGLKKQNSIERIASSATRVVDLTIN